MTRGRAKRRANPAHTGEAVARAARERSEQERETPPIDVSGSHLFALAKRASRWWLAPTVLASCIAAASWATGTTPVAAQTFVEDLTPQAIIDLIGVDLIGQTPATTSSPAVLHLHIASRAADADFRAHLYAPVTTRAELMDWLAYRTPESPVASWLIDDARAIGTDESGAFVLVPIRLPNGVTDEGPDAAGDGWPMPLRLELVGIDGSVQAEFHTFLTPSGDSVGDDAAPPLMVAMVLDLRLPPSHLADGSAAVDEVSLDRVLGLAEVLIERSGVPLSVAVSPETLDALALIGDDTSVTVLRAALRSRQLLTTTWTSLDLYDWTKAVRVDVVLDGLRRSAEALRWAGLEASPVMHVEHSLTVRVVNAVTEPAIGVNAFVADAIGADGGPLPPVTSITDASDRSYLMAQADPTLSAMLQWPDPELGAQWALAELSRMATEGTPDAVVVSAVAADPDPDFFESFFESSPLYLLTTSALEPTALALLLDGIDANPSLRPATVDDVLASQAPVGAVDHALTYRRYDPRDFNLYLARRMQVEQRLEAYESFLSGDPFLVAPLRTLLAVSASEHLTTGELTGFLNAVDQQVTQGTAGVEFVGRGPIAVVERNADLPVTLMNDQPASVTVALELASDSVELKQGERAVFTLEPGRNDLSVPVQATTSGRASVRVTVTTPDEAGAITLATGTFSVRFTDAEGLGLLILILAAAVLAAWWLQTLRRRARDTDSGSATVAAPGSLSDDVEATSKTGTIPSSGDHTRT